MKLFAGMETTDYQDLMRSVGALIDSLGYRDVRIWEHEDGMIIQGRPIAGSALGTYQTYLLTDEDLDGLLHQAIRKRTGIGRSLE